MRDYNQKGTNIMLNKDQIKKLRTYAHHEPNLVIVGKNGMTPTLLESFEASLLAHNLVKVQILKTADVTKEEVIDMLVDQFSVDVVSKTGRVVVLYRHHPKGRIKV